MQRASLGSRLRLAALQAVLCAWLLLPRPAWATLDAPSDLAWQPPAQMRVMSWPSPMGAQGKAHDPAILVADRMRKMIEEKPFGRESGLDIRLTISIGIASFPEHATTKQHLLSLADKAMYRGKDSTRNVVYLADAQTGP